MRYIFNNLNGRSVGAWSAIAPSSCPLSSIMRKGRLTGRVLFMSESRKIAAVLSLAMAVLILGGFGSNTSRSSTGDTSGGVGLTRYLGVLKSGSPQEKAEAAYLLGQQRSFSATAISYLVEMLGDKTAIDPSRYREVPRDYHSSLGEEAAVTLVHIGRPAIAPLIHVLKTSPLAEARKNAAWALGALHETGATVDGAHSS